MSKREHRRFTAEQKLEILREADQPGVSTSEVCRRHGLAPSVFYRWRAVAQGGSAAIGSLSHRSGYHSGQTSEEGRAYLPCCS